MTGQAGPAAHRSGSHRWAAALFVALLMALLPALPVLPATGARAAATRAADAKPVVTLSEQQAGKGGEITVKGGGWRPKALLMMLICGRSTTDRGVIGGTNSCANAEGRAVTTDARGAFRKKMPVAEPPVPCPCVVHVATVTGEQAAADAVFVVAGHPIAPLPKETGGGRLAVLATTRLEGDSGVLTWFGAPPARHLVFTVGNLGSAPVKDPVFEIGTAHGVFAPSGRSSSGAAPSGPAARRASSFRSNWRRAPTATTRSRSGTAARCWPNSRGGRPPLGRHALLDPAVPGRTGRRVPDRHGGRRQGAAPLLARPGPRRTPPPPGPADATAKPAKTPRAVRIPGRRRAQRPVADPVAGATDGPAATTAVLPWFTPDSAPSENRPTTKGHS